MSFKKINILIVFFVLAIVVVVLYIFLGSGWSGKKGSVKKEFDFQILLPEGSIYKLEEIEDLEVVVEIAPTIWFKESEKIETSLVQGGEFKSADFFLSESKPFGKISLIGTQQMKNEEAIYLDMSAYVFYRPFVEENLTQKPQDSLDSCLWSAENPVVIDSRSTAIACLINNYLVFSGFPSAEDPFVYSLPSSIETLSDLSKLLSHPKFPELQNKVSNLLLTGTDSLLPLWLEEGISSIISEMLESGESSFLPSEEDLRNLPQAKDAEITFQLGQELWKLAVGLKNFDQFSITYPAVRPIANKVTLNGGKLIIQKSSSSAFNFCAYSQLNEKRDGLTSWYCIDSSGAKRYLTTDPSTNCNQDSFTCSCVF